MAWSFLGPITFQSSFYLKVQWLSCVQNHMAPAKFLYP